MADEWATDLLDDTTDVPPDPWYAAELRAALRAEWRGEIVATSRRPRWLWMAAASLLAIATAALLLFQPRDDIDAEVAAAPTSVIDDIAGTRWVVTSVDGVPLLQTMLPWFEIAPSDHSLHGFDGCDWYGTGGESDLGCPTGPLRHRVDLQDLELLGPTSLRTGRAVAVAFRASESLTAEDLARAWQTPTNATRIDLGDAVADVDVCVDVAAWTYGGTPPLLRLDEIPAECGVDRLLARQVQGGVSVAVQPDGALFLGSADVVMQLVPAP